MEDKEKSALQKEIVDSAPDKPHGRFILSPRLGKTKITIDLIKKNNPESILWVTPSRDLANKDIPEEFKVWNAEEYLNRLTTTTWKSLNKITGHFEMAVFDEEQYISLSYLTTIIEAELTFDYILSMSGTKTESKVKNGYYKKLGLEILYEYDMSVAIEEGMLANCVFNIIKVPLSLEKTIEAGNAKKRFMTSEAAQYAYLSGIADTALYNKSKRAQFAVVARMRAIYNSYGKKKAAKELIRLLEGKKLIFCATTAQAEELCPNVYHGKSPNDKALVAFQNDEIEDLALVNKGGTGYTYRGIKHLIMVQADSDVNGQTSQKIARTLLKQGDDYVAQIWFIVLEKTKDEEWVNSVLKKFNPDRIKVYNLKNGELNEDK